LAWARVGGHAIDPQVAGRGRAGGGTVPMTDTWPSTRRPQGSQRGDPNVVPAARLRRARHSGARAGARSGGEPYYVNGHLHGSFRSISSNFTVPARIAIANALHRALIAIARVPPGGPAPARARASRPARVEAAVCVNTINIGQ
jgi:hypothetical protein